MVQTQEFTMQAPLQVAMPFQIVQYNIEKSSQLRETLNLFSFFCLIYDQFFNA